MAIVNERGIDTRRDARATSGNDLATNPPNEAARRALEEEMKGYEYQSDFAKKYMEQGRAEGRVEAARRVVLIALRVRGIAVPEAARERTLAQTDLACLERWFEKAIVAATLAEVFAESG